MRRLNSIDGSLLAGSLAAVVLGVMPDLDAATKLDVRYSPLHPQAGQATTFTISAKDPSGIKAVRLYIYDYAWQDIELVKRRHPEKAWDFKKPWNLPSTPTTFEDSYSVSGFSDNSFITFIVRVYPVVPPAGALYIEEYWGFAAGSWAFNPVPIPLWIAPPALADEGEPVLVTPEDTPNPDRIDIVFVADEDSYPTVASALGDLEDLIFDGFLSNNAVLLGKQYWAFHYSPIAGSIDSFDDPTAEMVIDDSVYYATNIPGNAALVVHNDDIWDWSNGHFASAPVSVSEFATTLHELGHSVFNLGDEHEDALYYATSPPVGDPYHNIYSSKEDCIDYLYNSGIGNYVDYQIINGNFVVLTDCNQINRSNPGPPVWRAEPVDLNCVMRVLTPNPNFAHSCIERVRWYYENL